MRRAAKVDDSQAAIVSALRQCRCKVDVIGQPVDLLVRIGSLYATAECKTPGRNSKRRQPAQVEHQQDASTHKAPHYVLMSVDDALAMYKAVMDMQGRGCSAVA